jgi:hypothetical protein
VLISEQEWTPRELRQCLEEIVQAAPQLAQDPQYQRLLDYCRMSRI